MDCEKAAGTADGIELQKSSSSSSSPVFAASLALNSPCTPSSSSSSNSPDSASTRLASSSATASHASIQVEYISIGSDNEVIEVWNDCPQILHVYVPILDFLSIVQLIAFS